MENVHHYEVSVEWEKDRVGSLSSPELTDEIAVATPPQFAKGVPNIWSPEHLFVAAVNSCLMTTFLAIAENFRYDFVAFKSKATGKLGIVDRKYVMSEVTLAPELTIPEGADKEKALRILQKSEAACLISNSIKSKINFVPVITVQQNVNA